MSDVLIIGGGPAGAACALRLRQHGIAVTVVESRPFPRVKVCGCCLGGAGLDALSRLGLDSWAESSGTPLRRWRGSIGGREVELRLPRGVAISRETLDSELLRQARAAGAEVHQPAKAWVESLTDDHAEVTIQDDRRRWRATVAAVVIASGLNGGGLGPAGSDSGLRWIRRPHGPFGIGFLAEPPPGRWRAADPGLVAMACDDDGYVGLTTLEDGRLDVAAALVRGGSRGDAKRQPIDRIRGILDRSTFGAVPLAPLSAIMATGPLRRTRLAGRGRVLAVGDAAGYVEPFTGEGMTWALESGIAAADRIAAPCGDDRFLGDRWHHDLARQSYRRRLRCRGVTTLLRWGPARRVTGVALAAFPQLASPLVRSLDHGSHRGGSLPT